MSKNKYILPFKELFYIEYGGISKKTSHSYNLINQRYAYDFEIRKDNLPYHDNYLDLNNFYCYKKEIIAPFDGLVVDIKNDYLDTKVLNNRPIINESNDARGNYILIKHPNNEYSLICHILKNSFKVNIGDFVKQGEVLGLIGNSGNTDGPHIHFSIQDRFDFYKSKSIKITFKNIEIIKNNKSRKKKKAYIEKDSYVRNL